MKRITILILLIVVVIPAACILLNPKLTEVDFLSVSLAVFSLTVAIVTFFAPSLLKLRDKAAEIDLLVLKNKQIKKEMLEMNSDYLEKSSKIQNTNDYSETITKAKKAIQTLTDQINSPSLISSDIDHIIDGYHDYIKWCIMAIVFELVVVEILFTSEGFIYFVGDSLSFITSGWPLSSIRDIITCYLKIVSLTLPLFFLVCASNDMISIMKRFRAM